MAQGKLKVKSKVPDKKKNKNNKGMLTISNVPLLVYELKYLPKILFQLKILYH